MKQMLLILFLASEPTYLFYLHGRAIEEGGRNAETTFGRYHYDDILDTFKARGFTVVSEARPRGTDGREYAKKVVGQIRKLIADGVAPGRITVVGASKGSTIAMLVSTELQHPDVGFVLMGNCNDSILESLQPRLAGRVLSIYDRTDTFGHSCERFRAAGTKITSYKEIEIDLGHGHGFLYKPYREWVEPAVEWARGR